MASGSARPWLRALLAVVAVLASAAACAPRVTSNGNLPDAELVKEIKPGVHTRAEVIRMIGSPSSVSTFDKNTWYYISKKTETLAFFEPKVVDQQVLLIRFDGGGAVKDIRRMTLDDAKKVQISSRKSRTLGKELTLVQQLYKTLLRGRGGGRGDGGGAFEK